ncbi:MAG: methionyl-tRNA formyltransferase [Lentisphaerae bacterium]|nr:methionyl-tRNA formyltransferase [Lentisphaerota bacterium]
MSDKPPVRTIFLCSGRLGIPIIDALRQDSRIQLLGIYSQVDKPVGRKKVIAPTVFTQHCLQQGLSVERVSSVNNPAFLEYLRTLDLDLLIVVSFGQLLKEEILSLPEFGCLNVHASLLPKYRGASPIASAILQGETETGVTFMKMDKGLDTGPIYQAFSLPIGPMENCGQLEWRLGNLAAAHLPTICWQVCRENLQFQPQKPTSAAIVRKISKTDGAIHWDKSASMIAKMVRAYTPWPKAYSFLPTSRGVKRIQITQAVAVGGNFGENTIPGQILPMQDVLGVACGSGCLKILRIVPEGRKEMNSADFLRGNPVTYGTVLSSE